MKLTTEERDLLAGQSGEALQRAMQIIATLGRIYEADCLLPVTSVQVAGVSFRNLGEAGTAFLRDWAAQGAHVRVPTTLNPAGMDLRQWQRMGISEAFARRQIEIVGIYETMGIRPTCTCTPYLVGNVPRYGEHVAWSESSAVVYANSVLGARSNREGGPSALAAAISGRTAAYGLHLDDQRRATHRVRVCCSVRSPHEYAALGYLVGRAVRDGIPYLVGLELSPVDSLGLPDLDALKLMGAAMAASGAVALYHIEGVTPEARIRDDLVQQASDLVIDSLEPAMAALNAPLTDVDLVVVGCPHASLQELAQVAEGVRGQRLHSALWVTASRQVREQGERLGLVSMIEEAGGHVIADGCVIVAPMGELPYRTLATNSAKMATYALSHAGLHVRFGSLGDCLGAALKGSWAQQHGYQVPPGPALTDRHPSMIPVAAPQEKRICHPQSTGKLRGRVVVEGRAEGMALVSAQPISFLGGVDPESGCVIEREHPLYGQSVAGRVLVFPMGKGSTVGSYIIYRLAKMGRAPCAIINATSEPIVAVGALIAGIPMVDKVDVACLKTGMRVRVEGEVIHFG